MLMIIDNGYQQKYDKISINIQNWLFNSKARYANKSYGPKSEYLFIDITYIKTK